MTQDEALHLIQEKRVEQERLWPRSAEHPRRRQYQYWAPHLLVLEEKVARIRGMWYNSSDEDALAAEFAKIGAIAVRALEEVEF